MSEPFGLSGAPVLSGMSFLAPDNLVGSAWVEQAPFAFWLVEAVAPRAFVELGTHNGYSYFAVCQAVPELSRSRQADAAAAEEAVEQTWNRLS